MTSQQSNWRLWIIILLSANVMVSAKELVVQKLIDGLHKPVFLTAPVNSSDTLFIVEQHGVIRSLINGELLSDPLLDIIDRVHQSKMPGDERGLLGMALHPKFQENGQFFVNYVDRDNYTMISRFEVDMNSSIKTDPPHSPAQSIFKRQFPAQS